MKLLFVCTHNRCRSILAEAMSRQLFERMASTHPEAAHIQVASAGSQPAGCVFPGTLNFLASRNINTESLESQSWDAFEAWSPDIVITVCDSAAGESCPLWMGDARKVHWGLEDPSKIEDATAQLAKFEEVAHTLETRLTQFVEQFKSDQSPEHNQALLSKLAG